MGWNGSQNSKLKSAKPGTTRGLRWRLSGGVAAVLLLVVAGVGAYLICREGRQDVTEEIKPEQNRQISEVNPTVCTQVVDAVMTNLPLNVKRDHSELTTEELINKVPHWAYTVEDRKRIDPTYEERHNKFLEGQAKIPWVTHVDRQLSMLLFAKNGNTGLLIPFDKKFEKKFLESLKTPTLVLHDDSDDLKEMKVQLNEVKAYLKSELDKGTDIVKLLNDEMKNVKKINSLRENLQKEVREFAKTATKWEEVDEMVEAANRMLQREGASEIRLPIDLKVKRTLNKQK